jgi:hypothetical protein
MDLAGARPVLPDYPKLAVATEAHPPVRVDAIAVLGVSGAGGAIEAVPVVGVEAHMLVTANTYKAKYVGPLCHDEMFGWAGSVARSASVYQVMRPAEGWTVDTVVNAVEGIATAHRDGAGTVRPAAP